MKKNLTYSIRFLNILVVIVFAFKLISCSKKYDYTSTLITDHCSNGKQDFDETGVDCGGVDCKPCIIFIPYVPCKTAKDSLWYNGLQYAVNVQSKLLSNNHFQMIGVINYSYDTLIFDFINKPTIQGRYHANISGVAANAKEVGTFYKQASLLYKWIPLDPDSSVYVQIINNKVHLSVCQMSYYDVNYTNIFKLELVEN